MTTPPEEPPPSREELDRQVRDHYGTWRDQPKGLACVVIAAFAGLFALLCGGIGYALAVVVG